MGAKRPCAVDLRSRNRERSVLVVSVEMVVVVVVVVPSWPYLEIESMAPEEWLTALLVAGRRARARR
jgi:hypothetical protein